MSQWVKATTAEPDDDDDGHAPHLSPSMDGHPTWINLDHITEMLLTKDGSMTMLMSAILTGDDADNIIAFVYERPEQLLAATSTDAKLQLAYQDLRGCAEDAAMDLGELARALTASNPRLAHRAQDIQRVLQTAITDARLSTKQQETNNDHD